MNYRGACRILYAPPHTTASDLRELLIFDRGAIQYDTVLPWRDLGVAKSGYTHVDGIVSLWLAEPRFEKIDSDLRGGSFALALLWKDGLIHGRAWEIVSLDFTDFQKTMDEYKERKLWRGEATTFPLRFLTQNEPKEL